MAITRTFIDLLRVRRLEGRNEHRLCDVMIREWKLGPTGPSRYSTGASFQD